MLEFKHARVPPTHRPRNHRKIPVCSERIRWIPDDTRLIVVTVGADNIPVSRAEWRDVVRNRLGHTTNPVQPLERFFQSAKCVTRRSTVFHHIIQGSVGTIDSIYGRADRLPIGYRTAARRQDCRCATAGLPTRSNACVTAHHALCYRHLSLLLGKTPLEHFHEINDLCRATLFRLLLGFDNVFVTRAFCLD